MKKLLPLLILSLLIFPFKSQAADIIDGDLIRAVGDLDVYIVKIIPSIDSGQAAKKFKRLILNPEIFNQYGHLRWEDIKSVSPTERDEYATSGLIRAVGDDKIYNLYPDGDTGTKRWIKIADDFLDLGYDWDAVYTINTYERDFYVTGENLTAPSVPEGQGDEGTEEIEEPSRNPITINVPADYSTIQGAIDNAIDGDTISIKAGTYNENIVIDKGVELIGESVGNTIIDGKGNSNAITITNGTDILIYKLTIKSQDKYGIYCNSSNDLVSGTIKINFIEGSGWGIVADGNCQLTILNNLIYNNKNSSNTDGAGILIKDNTDYETFTEISNNTIDDNYHGIWSENADVKALNNIISSNISGVGPIDSTGIYHSGSGELYSSYNDIWGNGDNFGGDAVPGEGSIVQDPDFLNAYLRNYRLEHGSTDYSPCLDAGHPDTMYNDGIYSSNTDRNDMGAYGGPENIHW